MKPKPKTYKELKDFSYQCAALVEHLKKHWDNLDCKPKGYAEFTKDYEDFEGIDEWNQNDKEKQEKAFRGFNDASDSYNFVEKTALPQVAYSDLYQNISPLDVLVGACVSYGWKMGELRGYEQGYERGEIDQVLRQHGIMNKDMLDDFIDEIREKKDE